MSYNNNLLQTISLLLLFSLGNITTIQIPHIAAYAQEKTQEEPFYMTMKLHKHYDTLAYEDPTYNIYKVITNLQNLFSQFNNKTLLYALDDVIAKVTIMDDSTIQWSLPYKLKDVESTPNVIKTTSGSIAVNYNTENYEEQFNTLTNVTTYTGTNGFMLDGEYVFDVNMNLETFPNGTGILQMTEVR